MLSLFWRRSVAWLLAGSLALPVSAAEAELSWGIEPFLPPRTMANAFKVSRDYMGERSGSRIVISSAASYAQFVPALLRTEYDLAFVGPHSGLLAMQKAGYVPLVQCGGALQSVLVVPRDSAYRKPEDLAGQLVALPDALTVTSMLGMEIFDQGGKRPTAAVRFTHTAFQNEGPLMMLRGEAAASVIARAAYNQLLSPQIRADLQIIGESRPVPHMMMLAHSRLPQALRTRLREAALEYLRTTDPAKAVFARNCLAADKLLGDDGARQLAPYAEELRRRLQSIAK